MSTIVCMFTSCLRVLKELRDIYTFAVRLSVFASVNIKVAMIFVHCVILATERIIPAVLVDITVVGHVRGLRAV